jgi:hypothetical protein
MFSYSTGKGWLVFAIVFCFSLGANLICDYAAGNRTYWNNHKWPFAISLLVSSPVCWIVGKRLTSRSVRVLVDQETGEKVTVRPDHAYFLIPIHWWGPLLAAIAIIILWIEFAAVPQP